MPIYLLIACLNKSKNEKQPDEMKGPVMEKLYKPGTGWKLIWADEFKGDQINIENWNLQVEKAGRFNDEWQKYTDSRKNAYVKDDCLVIKAIHESEDHGMNQYSSARINSAKKMTWKYGKIAARIKLPYGPGIWPAFWMLGANINENGGDTPWPQCGEVDILELYGSKDDSVVEGNIHFADASGNHASMGAVSYRLEKGKFSDSFHLFELMWTPEKFTWLVDGNEYASTSISSQEMSEFQREFFILFNLAVGGTYAGRPNQTTPFPQFMYIDWVRIYQKE